MASAPPETLTLQALKERIDSGALDPSELLDQLLDRIARFDPGLHTYIHVDADRLRAQLKAQLAKKFRGPLFGLPVTVKDNLCVEGEEVSCASNILKGFRSPYDATVIERLRSAGAVIIPRANMDEFAFGSSTETSAFGVTRNPWKTDRVPGGSSGGSAAAVASDLAVAALGSDTGGSIRQPASFCGVVGLKPTYGRVSRYGLIAFASSLDQIGPLTNTVSDAALLLSVIAGHDPRDSTSAPVPVPDYLEKLKQPIKGLKIGIPHLAEDERAGLDGEVRKSVREAIFELERQGASLVEEGITLESLDHAVEVYYIAATAEASSNLARYDGVQFGFRAKGGEEGLMGMNFATRTEGLGAEAKRRVLLGTYVLSQGYYDAFYLKAMKVRTLIKQNFDEAFKKCDIIAMPTAPTPAFKLGEKLQDPLQMYLSDIYTISANLAGVPAISVPCGFSKEGLPIGLQLLGRPFEEDVLLQVAHAYQQASAWHLKKPVLKEEKLRA